MKDELTHLKGRIRQIKKLVFILGKDSNLDEYYTQLLTRLYELVDLRKPYPRAKTKK